MSTDPYADAFGFCLGRDEPADTCGCDRLRPPTSRTITEADGALFSRTNTDRSGVARWTRTLSIPRNGISAN